VAGLESARDQLRIEQQGNTDEIARLLADIDELTENRTASMEKIDQLNLLNEELNAGVLSSTNAMEALKADGEAQLAKLKADIRDLSNTRDDYAAKIAQLESMQAKQEADRQHCRVTKSSIPLMVPWQVFSLASLCLSLTHWKRQTS
jgi:chromosome segregation ATPase